MSFKVGTFEITLDSSNAELAGSAGGSIAMDATTVTVAGPGGAAEASMSPQLVKLKAGAGGCLFDVPGKKLTVDGTTFDIK